MRRSSSVLLLIIILIVGQSSCSQKLSKTNTPKDDSKPQAIVLNVNDFESKLASMPNAQLIDVRTPGEFDEGYIKGAININYQGDSFEEEVAKLDKNKPTFVYCRSGGRSAESCNYMANAGFKELYDLDGGISAWTHYNKPVEKK